MSRFLARFKPNATRNIDALAAQHSRTREHTWLTAKGSRELWQDGKYSLRVYSAKWIQEKIDYVHQNPVRKRIVESPADYAWSSYAAYYPGIASMPPVPVDLD